MERYQDFGVTYKLNLQGKSVRSLKKSVNLLCTTWCHIPQGDNLLDGDPDFTLST